MSASRTLLRKQRRISSRYQRAAAAWRCLLAVPGAATELVDDAFDLMRSLKKGAPSRRVGPVPLYQLYPSVPTGMVAPGFSMATVCAALHVTKGYRVNRI